MPFNFGDTNVVKHCYRVYIAVSGITNSFNNSDQLPNLALGTYNLTGAVSATDEFDDGFVRVGKNAENPTITTAEGDKVALADCTEKILSETVEVNLEILEVTDANWSELRDHVHNAECDIIFCESEADTDAIGVASIKLSVQMSITGNDTNKISVSGQLENADVYAGNKVGFLDLS